jgi:peptide/nickel transport system ATP-binding protein
MAQTNSGTDVLATTALAIERPAAQLRLALAPLRIERGGAAALLGPSGAGKTTLLEAILGVLAAPEVTIAGERWFAGRLVPATGSAAWRQWLRRDVALLPQDARVAFDPLVRLREQVVELSGAPASACAAALRALSENEPDGVLARFPHQVSGGQAQRVLLALALARAPALLVADEPSASLDGARQGMLVAAWQQLRARGTAVLLATHDVAFAQALAASPFTVAAGRVTPGWPAEPRWPPQRPLPEAPALLLRARGLTVRRGGRKVLDDVDFALHAGEVVAVLGPSGAGKTTLLAVLAGLLRPAAGSVEHLARAGDDAARRRPPAQLLFQDAYASLTPGRSLRVLARETAPDDGVVDDLARGLGLSAAELARTARDLSGGQRRRAALLRALTVAPAVLLLDEPTASLDADTAASVMASVLGAAADRAAGCVIVTHDKTLARAVAHRTFVLEDGRMELTA